MEMETAHSAILDIDRKSTWFTPKYINYNKTKKLLFQTFKTISLKQKISEVELGKHAI